jgi:hypothetical protein
VRRDILRRQHLKAHPVAAGPVIDLPQARAIGPFEREIRQRHNRRLPDLLDRQAKFDSQRQEIPADRIEHDACPSRVGGLPEGPDQRRDLFGKPDRLSHGNPVAAPYTEHDERAPRRAEMEPHVPAERQRRIRPGEVRAW